MDIEDTYSNMLKLLEDEPQIINDWYNQYRDCVELKKDNPYS